MSDAGPRTSGVHFPPPLIYALALLAGWLLNRVYDLPGPGELASGILSIACFSVGAALLIGALGLFRASGINPLPWRPTSALTRRGPYRFTRNPMYLGMGFVYAGAALLFSLTWSIVLLPVVLLIIQTQVIVREERYLEATFGEEYRAYRARVRRWL